MKKKRKSFFFILIFLFFLNPISSLPVRPNVLFLFLNKPNIKIKVPDEKTLSNLQQRFSLEILDFVEINGIKILRLEKKAIWKINRISSSVDLSPFFKNKECIKSWESFHKCMSKNLNPKDEKLYQKLDRLFYSKLICQTGCPDPTFSLWEAHWYSPAYITISADIGEKGFKNLVEAKKSLRKINSLLKKVIYKARFPEDYGEGETPMEVFSVNKAIKENYDFSTTLYNILMSLSKGKFIQGLNQADLQAILHRAKGGNSILYLPESCSTLKRTKKGWVVYPNSVNINFDEKKCPVIKILRRRSP